MKKYVLGFANDSNGQFIFVRKQSPDWQKGFLNGVGGKIEYNEDSVFAMVREFLEETGIETSPQDWKTVCLMANEQFEVEVFKASLSANFLPYHMQKTDTEEHLEIYSYEDLVRKRHECISNLPWLVGLCVDKDQPFDYDITIY